MKSKFNIILLAGLLIVFQLLSVTCLPPVEEPVKIAVSKLGTNYQQWLLQNDSTLSITDLYPMGVDSALKMLEKHHGLLVTGGEDIFPGWYGMEHDTARCGEFDRYRDTLEIMLIKRALELDLPILGICRGHQILNVTLGGTLIIDIPDDIGTEVIHRCPDKPLDCYHEVLVMENSLIFEITEQSEGMVNTNHHQAVDKPAPGLQISVVSYEGLVEAIEWEDFHERPFLLGVQWHPERMEKYPELSLPVAQRFISEATLRARAHEIESETTR